MLLDTGTLTQSVRGILVDANLVNSTVVRACRVGGNVNNGANYGLSYLNANNAPSNSNWNYGSALLLTGPVQDAEAVSLRRMKSYIWIV